MKTRLQNILLVLASILFTFLLAELLVRAFYSQDKMITWIEMHPRGFMMNQAGGESFQEFGDRRAEYRFTENRLRGSLPEYEAKKILALGDSFTFGLHISEEETYVHRIEEMLSENDEQINYSVLNGGVGGAGLADWPAWLEEFGDEISPDIVLLFLNTADVERALSKNLYVLDTESDSLISSIRWKPRQFFFTLGRAGWYRTLQKHSELMNGIVTFLWQNFYFKDVTGGFDPEKTSVPIPRPGQFDPDSEYSLRLSEKLADKISGWCEKSGCRFIITTTGFFEEGQDNPYTFRFYKALTDDEITGSYLFFDNTPCVMEKSGNDLDSIRIPGDSHPDEHGAEIIAGCTAKWLKPFVGSIQH